jgi:3-oxoacyl-[acyl-carrier protein] reductase
VVVSDLPGHGLEQRIVETATREFGGLDLLVNNAGIALGKPFEETTDEEFDRIMNVNVRSVFRMTRAACRICGHAAETA